MTFFVDALEKTSSVTQIIVSIALMLAFGFFMTRLTKLVKLPNVTGYILAGILIGPYCLNLIPKNIIGGLDFISDIALAFIAFSIGEFFKFSALKKNGARVIVITIFEALMASLIVFAVVYFILGLNLVISIVLSALASATAPASTVLTIRQTKSKGEFVDTLLQVIALDDIISLLAYSVAISIALASLSGGGAIGIGVVLMPILKNLASLAIGIVFGFILVLLMKAKYNSDNRLIVTICILFTFCAVSSLLSVSPLLGCMAIGTVYINCTNDEKLFLQVNYFAPPVLLLFFVKSGMGFDLSALVSSSSSISLVPLWAIGLIYFIMRIVGKYSGAYLGCLAVKKKKEIRNNLGLALIPQASIAIGLATLGARALGGDIGNALLTIVLASSILCEIIGPACAKLSLYLSKSYSNKLEDVTNVEEVTKDGVKKTEAELLIERIKEIEKANKENPVPEISREEQAFTEASEEAIQYNMNRNRNYRRRF